MSKTLKILFVPIEGVGHVNAAVGIAQVLIERGHKVLFVVSDQWKGRPTKYGIEEVILNVEDKESSGVDPASHWAHVFESVGAFKPITPLEKECNIRTQLMPHSVEDTKKLDPILEQLLNTLRPDVIVLDKVLCLPSVEKSGIPWVLTCSFNPLYHLDDYRTAPSGSGLPAVGHQNEWKTFRNTLKEKSFPIWSQFNDYVVSRGVEPLKTVNQFCNHSKYLNIYGFPEELDYTDVRPLPEKWFRFDNLKRSEVQNNFEIPPQLANKSGKLIYFSLGSMGGTDVQLIKRLVTILGHSSHRYIVSKGPLHSQYELPPNMWGQQSVPQMQVLPIVSLVITHGGNNTLTETFFYGKPLIVLPFFGDQYDNAQRVHEKGFGIRLDPHLCSEDELLSAIEKLLNDKELNEKLHKISKRIQTENKIEKLAKNIEDLVKTFENK